MKPKKLSKKLGLNKKTIADLNNGEMKNAYGREQDIYRTTYAFPDCVTCPTCQTCQTCETCQSCNFTDPPVACTCDF